MEKMAHFYVKMIYNHPIGVMNGMKLFIKHLNLSKKNTVMPLPTLCMSWEIKNLDAEI